MVSNNKKFFAVLFFLLVLAVLTGCTKSPAEKIYDILEKVVAQEQVFEEQQEPIMELEQKENDLYDQIIKLGMKEFDKIVELSKEGLEIVDKREGHIEKERDSIQASKKEFENIRSLIDKLEDADAKELGNSLYETMMNRYKYHDELYEHYKKGIKLDRELYKMFQDEELSYEELEQQIEKINGAYQKVLEANEKFNEETKKYNEMKIEFYKAAGLSINEE